MDIIYQAYNRFRGFIQTKTRTKYTFIILTILTFYTIFVAVSLIRFQSAEVKDEIQKIKKEAYKKTDQFNIFLRVIHVSPNKNSIGIAGSFMMGNTLRESRKSANKTNEIYYYYYNSEVKEVNNKVNWEWEFSKPTQFTSGDSNQYPFDKYQVRLELAIFDENEILFEPYVVFEALTQGYEIDVQQTKDSLLGLTYLDISITRSNTVLSFAILLLMFMWALTFAYLYLVAQVIFYRLEPLVNLLPLGSMIMFAIPNLRRSMPEVPAIGCWVDKNGYLWALFINAVTTISCIIDYLIKLDSKV